MGIQGIWSRRIGAAMVVLAFVTGCSSAPKATGPGKYEQTWTASYADTTCADWNSRMTEHQRWVAAADMLVNARKTWNVDSMPSDDLVSTFEDDVSQGCDPKLVDTDSITDIATTLLLMGGKAEYGS